MNYGPISVGPVSYLPIKPNECQLIFPISKLAGFVQPIAAQSSIMLTVWELRNGNRGDSDDVLGVY